MLAAKPHRHNRSEATDDETLGVDHDPLFVDFGGLSRKRAHLCIHEWNCARKGGALRAYLSALGSWVNSGEAVFRHYFNGVDMRYYFTVH
jgi:hypothetical protein